MGEFFENTFTVSPDQPILRGTAMQQFTIPQFQNRFRDTSDQDERLGILAEFAIKNGLCGDAPDIHYALTALVKPVEKAA